MPKTKDLVEPENLDIRTAHFFLQLMGSLDVEVRLDSAERLGSIGIYPLSGSSFLENGKAVFFPYHESTYVDMFTAQLDGNSRFTNGKTNIFANGKQPVIFNGSGLNGPIIAPFESLVYLLKEGNQAKFGKLKESRVADKLLSFDLTACASALTLLIPDITPR